MGPTESLFRKLFPGGGAEDEAQLTRDQKATLKKLKKAAAEFKAANMKASKAARKDRSKARSVLGFWRKKAQDAGLADLLGQPEFSMESIEEMTTAAREMMDTKKSARKAPRWKDGGHTGYSIQKVWEMYVKALKDEDHDGAMTWYYEFWMKGGDQHAADVAMATSGRSAPKKAVLPFRRESRMLRAMGDLLAEKTLTIRTAVPDVDLDTDALVQRVKSYGKDARDSYGLFVKARGLRPEIGNKEFLAIFDRVSPDPHVTSRTVEFDPTHKSKADAKLTIMVTQRTPDVVKYILGYGGTGSDPAALFDKTWKAVR